MRRPRISPCCVLAAVLLATPAWSAPLAFVDQEAQFFGTVSAQAEDDEGVYDDMDAYELLLTGTSVINHTETAEANASTYAQASAESSVTTVARLNNLRAEAYASAATTATVGNAASASAGAWVTSLVHFTLAEETQFHLRGQEINIDALPFIGLVGPQGDVPLEQELFGEEVTFEGVLPAGDYFLGQGVAFSFSEMANGSGFHTGAGTAVVRLAVGPLGDGNGDGAVTGADFTIWSDHFGDQDAYFDQGDYNLDGRVTGADFTVWSDHFGEGLPAAPVPEPAASALAAGALAGLGWQAARRRRRGLAARRVRD